MSATDRQSDHAGYLDALSPSKSWKRRYFVLHDNFLLYFKSESSPRPHGVIPLDGSKVQHDQKCIFRITTSRTLYRLRAVSSAAAHNWVSKLSGATTLDISDRYDVEQDDLGIGTFSKVKRATCKRTGKQFAIKIINKKDLVANRESVLAEITILRQCKHPNVIQLFDVFETKKELFLVLELLTGGELFDRVVELGSFTERDAALLLKDMVGAVKYLHDQGIVHRDIKPENILFDTSGPDGRIKITDFGLSKILRNGDKESAVMSTVCGTPGYVAPEVLMMKGYDKAIDSWSIGVILYILLCGFPPFYGENDRVMYEQIKRADYDFPEEHWAHISSSAKDLVRGLLELDPRKRATLDEVLQHRWLKEAMHINESSVNVPAKIRSLIARRKFKRAVNSVLAIHRFQKAMSFSSSRPRSDSPEKKTRDRSESESSTISLNPSRRQSESSQSGLEPAVEP